MEKRKIEKKKEETIFSWEGFDGVHPETVQKLIFFAKKGQMFQEVMKQLRQKKTNFEHPRKKEKKKLKKKKENQKKKEKTGKKEKRKKEKRERVRKWKRI